MHFLDAWTSLSPIALARLAFPAGFLVLAIVAPGRTAARVAAVGVGLSLLYAHELWSAWIVAAGWMVLWLAVAWQAGRPGTPPRRRLTVVLHGVESGTVGLLLAPALLVLLVAVVARLDLPPEPSRRASYGIVIVALGLLHLMLRRHVLRATLAFAALGLGVEIVQGATREALVAEAGAPQGAVLLATALAVALAIRLGRGREEAVGTAWVSDAHDLHD